jgi:renalase
MSSFLPSQRIAVVGAGLSGAACAASLQQAGQRVTLFDKSRGVGGRMATRRAVETGADGTELVLEFDHGAQHFSARQPRFRAAMQRAAAAGALKPWRQRVHAPWPAASDRDGFVPVPNMPALVRHLSAGLPLQLGHAVQRLQRSADGWGLVLDDGSTAGPFDQVVLAMPPAQAAALLVGHHDLWATELAAVRMEACWTLMAVTDDVDWPWDAAVPQRGPLAWVARNERAPGRAALPGRACWVAQATPVWSNAHLEDDADRVKALQQALAALLPHGASPRWHHGVVHRWRYALPAAAAPDRRECWWDATRGLGVCGDFLAGGGVEAAWRSGDELADTVAASLEEQIPMAEAA